MKNTFKKLCAIFVIAVMLLPMLAVNVSAATYIWPLDSYNNYITSYAGNRIHPITGERQNHSGIDIRAAKGESVYATAAGTAYIGCDWCSHNYGKSKSCGCGGGYGNYVYIVHNNGNVSYYAHLTKVKVYDGEYVSQGSTIGTVGSTGSSTGYHLHFEMRTSTSRNDRKDPLNYVSVPGSNSSSVIPEEENNTSSSTPFNPNVVDYYTGIYTGPSTSTGSSSSSDAKSGIDIDMTAYPQSLKKGASFNLKGTVSAAGKLSTVKGRILAADGSNVQTTAATTSSTSLNINKCDINKKLRFGSLPEGHYYLLIEATAKDGSTASWKQAFTVGNPSSAAPSIPEESTGSTDNSASSGSAVSKGAVTIDVSSYPTSLTRGKSFSLRGTISSSAKVDTVRGYILDANGNEVQSTRDTLSSKSIDLKSLNVNKKLSFGKLAKGTYTLKIVAMDASNNIGTWEQTFTVK